VPVAPGPPWSWEHGAAPDRLDLLQGEFARPGAARGLAGKLSRAAILAAAIVAVAALTVALDWLAKSRERRAIQAEMAAIYRDTAGPGAPVIDPPRQLARALADLKRQAGEPLPDDFLAMVGALSDHVVEAGPDRAVSLAYESGVLTAELQSPEAAAERLRARTVPGYQLAVEPPEGGRSSARVRLRPAQ
jgi:type II secretory pathway component PulL